MVKSLLHQSIEKNNVYIMHKMTGLGSGGQNRGYPEKLRVTFLMEQLLQDGYFAIYRKKLEHREIDKPRNAGTIYLKYEEKVREYRAYLLASPDIERRIFGCHGLSGVCVLPEFAVKLNVLADIGVNGRA